MINGYAVNAAAINDQVHEQILLDGAADIALALAGDSRRGISIVGSTDVALNISGTGSAGLMISGADAMTLTASMTPAVLKRAAGSMPIVLDLTADMLRGPTLAGDTAIVFGPEFDLTRWAMGEGTDIMVLDLVGEGRTVGRVYAEGGFYVNFEAWLDGRRTPAHRPEMPFHMELALNGTPYLVMSEGGAAQFEFDALGTLRGNEHVSIEGAMASAITFRGEGRRYALVPVEGAAPIVLDLAANAAGRPPIPVDYVAAPPSRSFLVPRDVRRREFVYERRV